MNIRDLKYLVALKEHGHFGKAADACFVSQPALSMQIKKLEEFLGVQLLERTNKSVMFTAIGESMLDRARLILQEADTMKSLAREAADPLGGELQLGIFPTLAPYLLPHVMPKLTKKFPRLSMFLLEEKTGVLLQKLQQGKVDAAIIALPVHDNSLVTVPLFEEEFFLAVPGKHKLAKRKIIKSEDIADQTLMLLEEGHCLREQALSFCYRINAAENQCFRATSLETLRHMVASGLGMTLMPRLACQAKDGVTYIPFRSPKPSRTIGLVWRATAAKQQAVKEIARLLQQINVFKIS